ncbi:MAG: UDP-N-acetylglucosamine 2-epimerase (non-hydrolyzing) [Myxococcales bacterium]|nr:UDP-N-acetylglucosamine 2-epimerase (non-hydrolyzing) [Myxococcales bacterium]
MRAPLLFVVGTRPEAIKLAPILLEARARDVRTICCTTGQHSELVRPALAFFDLTPDIDLALEKPDLTTFTGRAVGALGELMVQHRPRAVLVQGDTSSALAGGLAGVYARAPVVHVEAGLRSYDRLAPFPEETHRVLLSHLASLHCAPTAGAAANLAREGITQNVLVAGNTVIDALRLCTPALIRMDRVFATRFPFASRRLVLATVHRRESFGPRLEGICRALRTIVERHHDVELALPVHPHPSVQQVVRDLLAKTPRVHLLEPLPYPEMLWLLRASTLVLTDSGGLQEEAPAFGKPVLVLRDVTERPEGIAAGCAQLVGTEEQGIVSAASRLLSDPGAWAEMAHVAHPYGDGHAAEAIVDEIERRFP